MKITAIHFRKLSAVTEMKMRTLMSKNFIIMPIFSLGFSFLMKILTDPSLTERSTWTATRFRSAF